MAREVVVAFPKSAVVMVPEATVVLPVKVLVFVKVLLEYVFGIVEEASMKAMAEVVENERPTLAKYVALVVENARPVFCERK
jgi:hypothetical protein